MPAARTATLAPVSTEPTKPTPDTPGWPTRASPTTGPGPGTKLKTPGGRPASALTSAMTSARIAQHAAVDGAGTQTTVFPAASAGANSSAPIVYGQFHGLTTPTTPSGTRPTRILRPAETDSGSVPARRFASSPAILKYSASSSTSSNASATSGLPWSSVSARASSSRRAAIAAMTCSHHPARSNADAPAHAGQAAAAARTASSTSAGPATATVANVSPDDGLVASAVPPLPRRQAPSM